MTDQQQPVCTDYDDLRAELVAEQHINRQLARNVLEAQAERDRYRMALEATMRRIARDGIACWCPPIFDDREFHTSDCERARAALAGGSDAGGAP